MASDKKQQDQFNKLEIVGEGLDEDRNRYLKIEIAGSSRPLRPYSMKELLEPRALFRDISNVGYNLFTKKSQSELIEQLQNWEKQDPIFTVINRLADSIERAERRNEAIWHKPSPNRSRRNDLAERRNRRLIKFVTKAYQVRLSVGEHIVHKLVK